MTSPDVSPELLKWAIGAVAACTVSIVGAVVWLASLVFKVGEKYGSVETELETIHKAGEKLERANEQLARIPVIEMKVDQLAASQAEERRRFASEWPEMREKVATLWEKVFSLQNWRKSQGQYGE